MSLSEIIERHPLSDGRAVWIQRIKIPGVRRPILSVVTSSADLMEGPTIQEARDMQHALNLLAVILRADVLETDL